MTLLPIGRFSKMTRLSVKALRLYADKGLLSPAFVDPSSGYRYYDPGQANRAEAVRILRSVDMSLDEIRTVLESDDPELIRQRLIAHRERLAIQLAAQQRMLVYLESLIQRNEGIMPYDVQTEEQATLLVAGTKIKTSLAKISTDIQTGFSTLWHGVTEAGLAMIGAPLLVYHDEIDKETEGTIEICVPVDRELTEETAVYTRELDGGMMVTTIHRGPYEEIGPAYHTLSGWISEHGHEIVGPPREVYLNDPRTVQPAELLTRVEFPISS